MSESPFFQVTFFDFDARPEIIRYFGQNRANCCEIGIEKIALKKHWSFMCKKPFVICKKRSKKALPV